MSSSDAIERLPTGISGFDQVALGGLPAGRSTLVTGTTGSGKTLFAVEFLAHGIRALDQAGVFVTFEETAAAIRRNARSMGKPIELWEREEKWTFVDASDDVEDTATVGDYDFSALIARIEHAVRRTGATRVALTRSAPSSPGSARPGTSARSCSGSLQPWRGSGSRRC